MTDIASSDGGQQLRMFAIWLSCQSWYLWVVWFGHAEWTMHTYAPETHRCARCSRWFVNTWQLGCCSVFEGALSDHIPVVHASLAECRIIGRLCAGMVFCGASASQLHFD